MSNIPNSSSFRDLLPQVKRWQEGESALREVKKHLQENPKETLEVIFEVAEDHQLGWQTYLLDQFGVDAEAMTFLKEFKPTRTVKAVKELLVAGSLHTFWSRVLGAKADAMAAAATYTMPDAIDALGSEERHRVYRMIGMKAYLTADGSFELSGDVMSFSNLEISSA